MYNDLRNDDTKGENLSYFLNELACVIEIVSLMLSEMKDENQNDENGNAPTEMEIEIDGDDDDDGSSLELFYTKEKLMMKYQELLDFSFELMTRTVIEAKNHMNCAYALKLMVVILELPSQVKRRYNRSDQ